MAIGFRGTDKPQAQGEPPPARQSIRLLIILSVLLAFASISTDLYPAGPAGDERRTRRQP